jgi:hypothetical protein
MRRVIGGTKATALGKASLRFWNCNPSRNAPESFWLESAAKNLSGIEIVRRALGKNPV